MGQKPCNVLRGKIVGVSGSSHPWGAFFFSSLNSSVFHPLPVDRGLLVDVFAEFLLFRGEFL